MKTADIFIRTYAGDAEWLRYCLRSIVKFATGFHSTTVVCPVASHDVIHPIAAEFGCPYDACEQLNVDDYVGQQATKMLADKWCAADIVCFMDSDSVLVRPFTPESVVGPDGKVQLLKTRYDGIDLPWQEITEQVVGFPVAWEYMRRHPFAYPKELLPLVRQRIEEFQGMPFEQFIRSIPGRHFSEFNAIGAVADRLYPEMIDWVDTAEHALPEVYVKQFWSWGGLTPEIRAEIETILS
jgi:hypothetical protein